MKLVTWLQSQDMNMRSYWLGLLLLFVGLAWGVSVATGLTVVGAVIIGESVLTSYLAQWLKRRVD
jgi:hypothetical protein